MDVACNLTLTPCLMVNLSVQSNKNNNHVIWLNNMYNAILQEKIQSIIHYCNQKYVVCMVEEVSLTTYKHTWCLLDDFKKTNLLYKENVISMIESSTPSSLHLLFFDNCEKNKLMTLYII